MPRPLFTKEQRLSIGREALASGGEAIAAKYKISLASAWRFRRMALTTDDTKPQKPQYQAIVVPEPESKKIFLVCSESPEQILEIMRKMTS